MSASPHTEAIFKGTASYFASNIISASGTFIVSLLVSWYLGKEGLGLLSVFLIVVLIGVLFSELGLNPLILREFAAGQQSPLLSLRSVLRLRIASSSAAAAILFLAAITFFPHSLTPELTGIASFMIITRSVGSALENFLKAQLQHIKFLAITTVNLFVTIAFTFLLLSSGYGITGVLFTLGVVDLVKTGFIAYLSRYATSSFNAGSHLDLGTLRPILVQSAPFAVIGILSILSERSDVLLLTAYHGVGESGVFAAADRFLVIASLVDSSLFASAFPILSVLGSHEDHMRVTRRLMTNATACGIGIAVILVVTAPFLIGATFRFSESVALLRVLAAGLPAMILNRVMRTTLYSLHKERAVAVVFGVSCVGNIVLNLAFIPQFGALAAAIIATITEYGIALSYGFLYVKRTARERPVIGGSR